MAEGREGNIGETDVVKILEEIRERAGLKSLIAAETAETNGLSGSSPGDDRVPPAGAAGEIRSHIDAAETTADAGADVTPMERFRGPSRWAALLAGKLIIVLASFITDRQRAFNRHVISALRSTVQEIERLDGEVRRLQQQQSEWQKQQREKEKQLLSVIRQSLNELK